jgi:hypothetical protein
MREKDNKIIIFAETKRAVDDLTRNMRRDGFVSRLLFLPLYFHTLSPNAGFIINLLGEKDSV